MRTCTKFYSVNSRQRGGAEETRIASLQSRVSHDSLRLTERILSSEKLEIAGEPHYSSARREFPAAKEAVIYALGTRAPSHEARVPGWLFYAKDDDSP